MTSNAVGTTTNKTAIITGGSRGLGRNTAVNLARRGVDVIFTYQAKREEAETVVREIDGIGSKAAAFQLNTGDTHAFEGFASDVRKTLEMWGKQRFDFLVNNAGSGLDGVKFMDTTEAQFDGVVSVQFKGVYFLTQKLLPLMNDGGRIVNISSGLARVAIPGSSAYAAVKGAIEVFTRYLAKELGPRQITANEAVQSIQRSGARAVAIRADIAKVSEIEHLFAASLKEFGHLDIVVANAGIELIDRQVADFIEADFDRVFGINAKGAFFTLQQAATHVADNGRVIYVGSSSTAYPLPGYGLYGGSKIAGQFLVEVLAKEVGHRGVAVNSILPTVIEGAGVFTNVAGEVRDFVRSFRPMQRMGKVEDVANAAEYLASDLSGFVSGQHLLVSGGAPA